MPSPEPAAVECPDDGIALRRIPGVRIWRSALRTAHLVAFGALYGGVLYGVAPERLGAAWAAAVGTGVAFAAFEVARNPLWFGQVRGLATGGKLLLVAAAAWRGELAAPLLTLTIVVGAVTSHMPGRFRYHSFRHGRAVGPREKG